jgi:phage shock protein C
MYCNYCGKAIQDDANVCAYCGRQVALAVSRRRLLRPRCGRKIAGVCLAFADYFDLDVTLIRIVWLLAAIFGFPLGIVGYIIAWVIIPEEPRLLPAAVAPPASQPSQTQQA